MRVLEKVTFAVVASALAFASVGCTSSSSTAADAGAQREHASPYPSCDAIIQACHPLDVEEGPIHDCHDFGHAPTSSEAACAAKKAECLAICVATDGGVDAAKDAAVTTDSGTEPDGDTGEHTGHDH